MDPLMLASDGVAVTSVVGWCQLVKPILPEHVRKWAMPLVALALGVVYGLLLRPGCGTSIHCAATGFAIGLAASGTFSGVKNAFEKKK